MRAKIEDQIKWEIAAKMREVSEGFSVWDGDELANYEHPPLDIMLTSNEMRDILVCMSDANQYAGLDDEMQKLQQKFERILKNRGEIFA